jgi:signal transduction histidine kinase
MRRRAPTIRTILAVASALAAAIALSVAIAMVVLTTLMHRSTESLSAAVESVRLAEDAQVDLLLHARAADPLVQRDLEAGLGRKLGEARAYVTTPHEGVTLEAARSALRSHLASEGPEERQRTLGAAYDALDAFVEINREQSRAARAEAAAWDDLANGVGLGVGLLVVVLALFLPFWIGAHAVRPVVELAGAMDRFARGDFGVRAHERGPAETRDLAARFNQMAERLADNRRAQAVALAGIAHDLRNPLNALKLAIGVARDSRARRDGVSLEHTLALVDRQIGRLDRMIGDLQDAASLQAGRIDLALGAHDAREIVSRVIELFAATSERHAVRATLPAEPIGILCDPGRLEQVVANLVSNAIKYSPRGGAVDVRLFRDADDAVIEVVDRGEGILERHLHQLFEPFHRLPETQHVAPGAGLGLFVVKRLVDAHGGRVEVESARGVGSTFRVRIPAVADGAPRSATRRSVQQPSPQNRP